MCQQTNPPLFYQIALPRAVYGVFDYLPPEQQTTAGTPGMLAKVSFGPQTLVGVIVNVTQHSQVPKKKQKPILTLLDSQPVIPPIMLELAQWIANYYHYPLGLTLAHMMPKALQQTKTKLNLWQTVYRRCDHTPPNLSKIQKLTSE